MRILTKNNYVDFEAPIYMSDENRKKFVDGMKKIFNSKVIVNNIVENKKEMGNVERNPIKFTEEDQIILADPNLSNEEVAERLGKSLFAVQMKRGPFLMELQEWAERKGKSKIIKEDVKEFLGDEK